MEIIVVIIGIISLGAAIGLLSVLRNLTIVSEEISNIKGRLFSGSFRDKSLSEKVSDLERENRAQKSAIETILQGLPNLFKDDIELVQKIDYPNSDGYHISMTESGLEIAFLKRGTGYPKSLDRILSRASEIRKVKEKCCPKKGKKRND